jgi:enoyl-CoA hydratase
MLAADLRIGVEGPFNIGLNEVKIGLTLPSFAVELARYRLTPAYFNRGLITGEMFGPAEALTAGFLDRVMAPAELKAASEAAAGVCSAGSHGTRRDQAAGPRPGARSAARRHRKRASAAGALTRQVVTRPHGR